MITSNKSFLFVCDWGVQTPAIPAPNKTNENNKAGSFLTPHLNRAAVRVRASVAVNTHSALLIMPLVIRLISKWEYRTKRIISQPSNSHTWVHKHHPPVAPQPMRPSHWGQYIIITISRRCRTAMSDGDVNGREWEWDLSQLWEKERMFVCIPGWQRCPS